LHFVEPSRVLPGSHLLFFALPKKSRQKKGDAATEPWRRLSLRAAQCVQYKKWESVETHYT